MGQVRQLVRAGGKRLRPAFCHWGYVAAGGAGDPTSAVPSIVDIGAAFELMHAFALFHDDVMDDADERRGAVATHRLFADRHAASGWAGESRRFGEGVAILVGDLAFVYSDMLLAGASAEVWGVWNELRIELNVGQLLDIVGSVRADRSLERAERVCRYKSGKYTVERPLHMGAAAAGVRPDSELGTALSAYGLPLGEAFQMRDDVMGAFGDAAVTGKPVGGDLREGKPTPLLARAYEGKPTPLLARAYGAADEAQRVVLDRVGSPQITDDEVAQIQQVIVDTGALTALEAEIDRRVVDAVAALAAPAIDRSAVEELTALAAYVTDRVT
ncbi:MAG: polyprenyl synthetase family protein [Actinobacteria bacterium]|nr:polyprenyl synthetase family protein [Actinomycetota bacterium]